MMKHHVKISSGENCFNNQNWFFLYFWQKKIIYLFLKDFKICFVLLFNVVVKLKLCRIQNLKMIDFFFLVCRSTNIHYLFIRQGIYDLFFLPITQVKNL